MATRYAVTSGLWSDPATWNGGTLPGPGDDVRANGFTVTIDQDIAVNAIATSALAPAIAGGFFVIDSIPVGGRNLNCTINGGSTTALTVNATSGVLTVTGSILGGTSNPSYGVTISGNITLNAPYSRGSAGAGSHGVYVAPSVTAGIINIAEVRSSSVTTQAGLYLAGVVVATLGDLIQDGSGPCVSMATAATVTVTGNITVVASNVSCVSIGAAGAALTVLGSITGGTGQGPCIGFGTNAPAIDLHGALTATNTSPVLSGTGGAAIRVRGPLISAPNGRLPLLVPGFTIPDTDAPFSMEVRDDLGQPVTLTNIVAASPPPADVRSGVAYGIDNTLTGTLPVPDAGAVAYGTPVDDATGTAALDLHDVAEVLGQRIATTIGG